MHVACDAGNDFAPPLYTSSSCAARRFACCLPSVTVAQSFYCLIHPVQMLLDGVVCAGRSLQDVMPPLYWPLIEDLWPGPLTLLLPASPVLAPGVSAGQPTVAVRMPSHPLARALIHASGKHVGQRDWLEALHCHHVGLMVVV